MRKAEEWAMDYLKEIQSGLGSGEPEKFIEKYDLDVPWGSSVLAAMFEKFALEAEAKLFGKMVAAFHRQEERNQNGLRNAGMAQLEQQRTCNARSGGSNPSPCSIASEKTDGAYYCTRTTRHDGPCAARPTKCVHPYWAVANGTCFRCQAQNVKATPVSPVKPLTPFQKKYLAEFDAAWAKNGGLELNKTGEYDNAVGSPPKRCSEGSSPSSPAKHAAHGPISKCHGPTRECVCKVGPANTHELGSVANPYLSEYVDYWALAQADGCGEDQ
jgi:hypothetical protein